MPGAKQMVTLCPDCDEEINFSQVRPKVGLKFTCPHCETNLEVVSVSPLQVDWDDNAFFEDDSDTDSDW